MNDDAMLKFREGVALAAENLVAEAAGAFREVVERWPASELADDALYNVGACQLALNQFALAAETFGQVVERYPDASISSGGHEVGRTAAKAWLGLVSAHLGLGQTDKARAALGRLSEHADSKVVRADGSSRTFEEIGRSLLDTALGGAAREADEVTSSDVA